MIDLKKKLEEEIAALDMELRVDLPREIAKARAHGDLSENAEYHAAKERQGIVNMRLGQLRARLRRAVHGRHVAYPAGPRRPRLRGSLCSI